MRNIFEQENRAENRKALRHLAAFSLIALSSLAACSGEQTVAKTDNGDASVVEKSEPPKPRGECSRIVDEATAATAPAAISESRADLVLDGIESLSDFTTILKESGVWGTFALPGQLTVFAPTNEAFDRLPHERVRQIQENPEMLTDLATSHILNWRLQSAQLMGKQKTLAHHDLNISSRDGVVYIDDAIKVTCSDVSTSNATIHVVDSVIVPMR